MELLRVTEGALHKEGLDKLNNDALYVETFIQDTVKHKIYHIANIRCYNSEREDLIHWVNCLPVECRLYLEAIFSGLM
jgi:hypothetical protein